MNHYQMTMEELLDPSPRKPKMERGVTPGTFAYLCPICRTIVGLKGSATYHEPGWLYKREACKNGHEIDWSKIK